MNTKLKLILLIAIIAFVSAMTFLIKKVNNSNYPSGSMMSTISQQLDFGARNVGTKGHAKTQELIVNNLKDSGVEVVEQKWVDNSGQPLNNIIGRINPQQNRRLIIATHYDTRASADLDSKNPNGVMPGANDGASGVAVLLELAKEAKNNPNLKNIGIDLVFFDAEEFKPGNFNNWQPKGSSYFANNLQNLYGNTKPYLAVNIDMVCDKDLKFYKDPASVNAAPRAIEDIWAEGMKMDSKVFLDKMGREIKDDSTLLVSAGIPTVLIIDLEYPYFHTTKDTLDKCSPKSLETTFLTLKKYLEKQK